MTRLKPVVLRWRDELHHQPQVLDPAWAEARELPIDDERSPTQTVALFDRTSIQRETDPRTLADAYATHARTRVYESIHARSDGWYTLVALNLARITRRLVVCTLYQSDPGDRSLGRHEDVWDGVIMQMRGVKAWTLWPHGDGEPREIHTRPGDVLLLPNGVSHAVSTTGETSVHLVFALTEPLAETAE